jgi:peroxiredoxin
MNRRLLLLIFVLAILPGCKNSNIEINGKLTDPVSGEYIYLDELKSNDLITVDSVSVSDEGTFVITRKIEFPSFYLLRTNESSFLTMLLEPGQILELTAKRDSLNIPESISGSEGTELMVKYNKKLQTTIYQIASLRKDYLKNLRSPQLYEVMAKIDSIAQIYLDDINLYTKKYIDSNLTSLVSLAALYQQVAPGEYIMDSRKDLKYFLRVDSALSIHYPDYELVRSLHEQVSSMGSGIRNQNVISPVFIQGAEVPEIDLPNPEGDTIRLSSTRGNIVLLDFWAAWCSPCRQENPNLVKAYNMYHGKGFQIYQVSLDMTRDAWIKGIQDDNLGDWIHVSDLRYWNSVVVSLYKIEMIPVNYLLDREGHVIASNLRGESLQIQLDELFKN